MDQSHVWFFKFSTLIQATQPDDNPTENLQDSMKLVSSDSTNQMSGTAGYVVPLWNHRFLDDAVDVDSSPVLTLMMVDVPVFNQ